MVRCNICSQYYNIMELPCEHEICGECLEEYINAGINAGQSYIECPVDSSCQLLSDELIEHTVGETQYNKMIEEREERGNISMCTECYLICSADDDGSFYCSNCDNRYCVKCRKINHRYECDSESDEDIISELYDVKRCPMCRILIQRETGCNSMKCTFCKIKFCWGCEKTKYQIDRCVHDCGNFGTFIETYSDDEYVDGYKI